MARALAKEIMHGQEGISPGDWVLWCLAAAMGIALFLAAPKLGKPTSAVGLLLIFLFLILPIKRLSIVQSATSAGGRHWRLAGCLVLIGLLDGAFGYWIWPETLQLKLPEEVQQPALVARVTYIAADQFFRFYQHPAVYFEGADTAMYVVITNQTDWPIYVQNYQVLALLDGTQWRPFKNLSPFGEDPQDIGMISDGYIGRIDLSTNGFDYLMRQGAIGGHKAVEAWMFFNSGLTRADIIRITKVRMTLLDSAGKNYVLLSDFPLPPGSADMVSGQLKILRGEPVSPKLREMPRIR